MSKLREARPLDALMVSPDAERAYKQGYDRGWRAAMAQKKTTKRGPSKKPGFAEGLRRRANWFAHRSDLALEAGDVERAERLEGWAQSELRRLRELEVAEHLGGGE